LRIVATSFDQPNNLGRQPGDLGVLRGVAEGVAKEARTRGFASLAFAKFAFIAERIFLQRANLSMRENTEDYPPWVTSGHSIW
jgi:hypothetical protein